MKYSAQLFQALSDETRLRILCLLLGGELCVCDLVAVLELPQSTVSRHMAHLKHAGLVCGRRQGVWMHYQLDPGGSELQSQLIGLLRRVSGAGQAISDQKKLNEYMAARRSLRC